MPPQDEQLVRISDCRSEFCYRRTSMPSAEVRPRMMDEIRSGSWQRQFELEEGWIAGRIHRN
jgi:hypothetical protein